MNQQNKFVSGLAALCAVVWVLAAIHPADRQAWILENLLVVLFVATLALAYRRLQLSNASYIFIALFVILESIVAEIIAPGKGVEWLGGQGDEWDAQNDILSALLGSLVMMAGIALTSRKKSMR